LGPGSNLVETDQGDGESSRHHADHGEIDNSFDELHREHDAVALVRPVPERKEQRFLLQKRNDQVHTCKAAQYIPAPQSEPLDGTWIGPEFWLGTNFLNSMHDEQRG